jgi:hypothetical protein
MADTPPKTKSKLAMDGMSSANFQALAARAKLAASAGPPASGKSTGTGDIYRNDSLSSANLQSLASRATRATAVAPAVASASTKPSATPPAKPK